MAGEVYLVIAADHLAREGRPMTRTKADAARFAAIARASGPSADERDTGYALWHPPLYIHRIQAETRILPRSCVDQCAVVDQSGISHL